MDSLIFIGDRLKAMDNGKVGGYAVRFSDDGNQKDLSGEYFTSKTYLGAHKGDGVDVLFHHGQALPVKGELTKAQKSKLQEYADHIFPPVKTKVDAIGLWAETVLDMSNEYEKAVYGMVKAGNLGWSSGTASHTAKVKSTGEITRWPIIEISLTPTPCEPQNRAISIKDISSVKFIPVDEIISTKAPMPGACDDPEEEDEMLDGNMPGQKFRSSFTMKITQIIDDLLETGEFKNRDEIVKTIALEAGIYVGDVDRILTGAMRPSDAKLKGLARALKVTYETLKGAVERAPALSIKGIFEDELADRDLYSWTLWDVYAKVVRKLVTLYANAKATGVQFDLGGKLDEVNAEYSARLKETIFAQANDYIADSDADGPFYLKSISNVSADILSDIKIDLDEHSQLVESAQRGVIKRFRGMHEVRMKAGRVLSDKNRSRIQAMMDSMTASLTDLQKILDESVPMASKEEKAAAESQFLRLQARINSLGAIDYVEQE